MFSYVGGDRLTRLLLRETVFWTKEFLEDAISIFVLLCCFHAWVEILRYGYIYERRELVNEIISWAEEFQFIKVPRALSVF